MLPIVCLLAVVTYYWLLVLDSRNIFLRCPLLLTIFMAVTGNDQQSDVPLAVQPVFAFVYAVLLHSRMNHLSAFQRILTVVLHCGHATEDVSVDYMFRSLLILYV